MCTVSFFAVSPSFSFNSSAAFVVDFDSCARFPDGVRSMAHYICGLAGEADAEQQSTTQNAAQKCFKNVASGLLKACRPMKMVYMGWGGKS